LHFLETHNPPAVHAALQLAANSRLAREQIRRIGLSVSGTQKLARLLISWSRNRGMRGSATESFRAPYTHEGIAQMIGTTRETVTRVLNRLKQKKTITIDGENFVIHDLEFLKRLARE
jgi:CRP/FNR family transcriptional regulator, cyclic AMP receptor protein